MSIWYRKRKLIIIIVSILIIVLSLTIFLLNKIDLKEEEKEVSVIETNSIEKKEVQETTFKVDIKGEINKPGIYSLKEGSRVIDVIEEAGGLTNQADTSVINLSKKIEDEMVIIIYSKKEVSNFKKTKEVEEEVQQKCIQKDTNALKNDACITDKIEKSKSSEPTKININTASLEELMTLTGIGESKAKDIIKYREKQKFKTIEEIKEVQGIGDSLFAKIKENITV
jgi:competence protein ComEA